MKFTITLAFALSATAATAALAQQPLPVPLQPGGCPIGYQWQGKFCFPLDLSTLRAIPKPRTGPCPYGWSVQRGYCVRLWAS
jgi:hypothetical protein